jgi:ADP-ribose 1''-phosphate phosphatase
MPKVQSQLDFKQRVAEQNSVAAAADSRMSKTTSKSTTPETTEDPTAASTVVSASPQLATTDTAKADSSTTEQPKLGLPSANVPKPQTLTLSLHIGDIFAAPPLTVLIHACNTQGSWGAGIAAAFRVKYPVAFTIYRRHCLDTHHPKTNPVPTGSCLLIPPSETKPGAPQHWIACLFTSARYGKGKDKPDVILRNTGPSVRSMLEQIKEAQAKGEGVGGLRMCKINSARFAVPWERTVAVLEGIEVEEGWVGDVEVWDVE